MTVIAHPLNTTFALVDGAFGDGQLFVAGHDAVSADHDATFLASNVSKITAHAQRMNIMVTLHATLLFTFILIVGHRWDGGFILLFLPKQKFVGINIIVGCIMFIIKHIITVFVIVVLIFFGTVIAQFLIGGGSSFSWQNCCTCDEKNAVHSVRSWCLLCSCLVSCELLGLTIGICFQCIRHGQQFAVVWSKCIHCWMNKDKDKSER